MNTHSQCVKIGLNIEQGRLIIEALSERQFKLVYELIGKLNHWANQYFREEPNGNGKTTAVPPQFEFSLNELLLTIKALGDLPFYKVHRLVNYLTVQLQEQLVINFDDEMLRVHGDSLD